MKLFRAFSLRALALCKNVLILYPFIRVLSYIFFKYCVLTELFPMRALPILLLALFLCSMDVWAQRNILLVIADDLGKDYCGFYPDHGGDTATMPTVRSLAASGMTFTNAWSNPVCSPTRAGILTGRYSFRTGVGDVIDDSLSAELDTAEITIPKLLKNSGLQGYATADVGKWHLHRSTAQSRIYPNRMGYDYYAGNFQGALPSYTSWTKIENGVSKGTITNYATTETVNDAITWLEKQSSAWFLWLAFNAPHTPFHKPPDNLHTVQNLSGTTNDINRNPVPYFKAMTEAMDTELGRLIAWLKSKNLYENTDIIFIGDNGTAQRVGQIADSNRSKGTIYQYGINVPFVVSGPSVIPKGTISNALINTQDIFATVLEIAGISDWKQRIPSTTTVDARSFLPYLRGEKIIMRDWIFSEVFAPTPKANDGKAIRNTEYKLLRFDDGREEFYHLAVDPTEQNNLLRSFLKPEEQTAYTSLCKILNTLLSKTLCSATVSVEPDGSSNNGIRIYPLPASSWLHIEGVSNAQPYRLVNVHGETLQQGCLTERVDIQHLPNGVYYLYVEEETARTWKIVVER